MLHHGKDGYACKSCNQLGHKPGDVLCPGRAEEGSILAFRSYEHVLSNHFMTPIHAFGSEVAFKSVEHAFFYKMAVDLDREELAGRIKNAAHAGIVKRLSKEMPEEDRIAWEDEHMDIMRYLLKEKAKTCEPFRNCLLMNKEKILAEGTGNKRWGAGLSIWMTEATKPSYWPGLNYLGIMLMELTSELLSGSIPMEVDGGSELNESDDEDSEEDTMLDSHLGEMENHSHSQEHPDTNTKHKTAPLASPGTSAVSHQPGQRLNNPNKKNKKKKEKRPKQSVQRQELKQSRDKTTNNDKDVSSTNPIPSSQKQEKSQENPTVKKTPTRLPDIRRFYNSLTGKRKTTDTTPEKNINEKKPNSNS